MNKIIFALVIAFVSSSMAEGTQISEALKSSKAVYQVIFQEGYDGLSGGKIVACKEGLLKDAIEQHSNVQYAYIGSLRVAHGKTAATFQLEANETGRFKMSTQAFYWPTKEVGHSIGGAIVYNSRLEETLFSNGRVLENGKAYRDENSPSENNMKQYTVGMNLNPVLDCKKRIALQNGK